MHSSRGPRHRKSPRRSQPRVSPTERTNLRGSRPGLPASRPITQPAAQPRRTSPIDSEEGCGARGTSPIQRSGPGQRYGSARVVFAHDREHRGHAARAVANPAGTGPSISCTRRSQTLVRSLGNPTRPRLTRIIEIASPPSSQPPVAARLRQHGARGWAGRDGGAIGRIITATASWRCNGP